MRMEIDRDLRERIESTSSEIREIVRKEGVLLVNLISSPGAGKTTLLEKMLDMWGGRWRVGIIEGDIETEIDAERIRRHGVFVHQINTRSSCHIQPGQLKEVLVTSDLSNMDILIVENVGNLVCPAEISLGEEIRIVMLSVAEGDEKPLKYPLAFRTSHLLVISKTDLVPYVDFDMEGVIKGAKVMNPLIQIIEVSAKEGRGVDRVVEYVDKAYRERFGG